MSARSKGSRRRQESRIASALVVSVVLTFAPRAVAQSPCYFLASGPATVSEARLEIVCRDPGDAPTLRCEVRGRFVLEAHEAIELEVRGEGCVAEGEPAVGARPVASGERVHAELSWSGALSRTREPVTGAPDFEDEPIVMTPIRVRHPVVGDRRPSPQATHPEAFFQLVQGPGVVVEGPLALDVDRAHAARVEPFASSGATEWGSVGATVYPELAPEAVVILGGPFLGLGGDVTWTPPPQRGRFHLRAGYEIAIADYFVASLAFETDFESIAEALVVEVASPEIWFFLPSFAAGVGVVARQLGLRDADAALRLRATIAFAMMGFTADFDYWPATGGWSSVFVGRMGI